MQKTASHSDFLPDTAGHNEFLPGYIGIPRKWGESDKSYSARVKEAQQPYQQANSEGKQIRDLAKTQETNSRAILSEQEMIQKKRLNDLASLLATQTDQKFNRNIPSIAESAQGQGFLETSGFGNALARNYTDLQEDTNNQLLMQGLSDRDLSIKSLGDISSNRNSMGNSALERQFSVTDNARAEALARELGKMGVSAPAKGPGTTDKILNNAGPILGGIGSIKGAQSQGSMTAGKIGATQAAENMWDWTGN